jgi:hypothetical protein
MSEPAVDLFITLSAWLLTWTLRFSHADNFVGADQVAVEKVTNALGSHCTRNRSGSIQPLEPFAILSATRERKEALVSRRRY